MGRGSIHAHLLFNLRTPIELIETMTAILVSCKLASLVSGIHQSHQKYLKKVRVKFLDKLFLEWRWLEDVKEHLQDLAARGGLCHCDDVVC